MKQATTALSTVQRERKRVGETERGKEREKKREKTTKRGDREKREREINGTLHYWCIYY